jgi:hypothetical protein
MDLDPYPLLAEIGYLRGHRVYWSIERNDYGSEHEDAMILADEYVEWGRGH